MKRAVAVLLVLLGAPSALPRAGAEPPPPAGNAPHVWPSIPAPDISRGCLVLGFDRLASYPFVTRDPDPSAPPGARPPTGEEQIPPVVKGWSGRRALITGFMLPTKLENGRAVEFLIMANQMACCYGITPGMNDWVLVRYPEGTAAIQDVPISFRGVLKVGAVVADGYVVAIYSMEAEGEGEVTAN